MRFAHTNIISTDWKTLVAFYIKVFECRMLPPTRQQSGEWLSKGTGVPNASLEGAHLLLPGHGDNGPTLEIYQYNPTESRPQINPNTKGIGHLAFEVSDVDNVLQLVLANGGSSNGEVVNRQVAGVGKITFVYARDPDGNLIELQQWDKSNTTSDF